MDKQPKILIGGEFRTETPRDPINVYSPSTGEVLWSQPTCGPEHVEEALGHARAALIRIKRAGRQLDKCPAV